MNYYTKESEAKPTADRVSERLVMFEELMWVSGRHPVVDKAFTGRNSWARSIDHILSFMRKYVLPLHLLSVLVTAIVLYCYARLVALTSRLRIAGERAWPNVPAGSVLALWHRDAPSLLIAFLMRRPEARCAIMISGDSRGDYLALFCRLLGTSCCKGQQ